MLSDPRLPFLPLSQSLAKKEPALSPSSRSLWGQVKGQLRSRFKGRLFDSVLNVASVEEENKEDSKGLITLEVPSVFHQKLLKQWLFQIKEQTQALRVEFQVALSSKTLSLPAPTNPLPVLKTQTKLKVFNPQWTFASFIEGPNNSFAYSLAKSVAHAPSQNQSNPLFIYGPSGLGKTHLLHAIGNRLKQEKPHLRVLYLSAERFFNDCISHIRKNEMSVFREKYRKNIQVLLLDDVPILGRGESTQDEFFHTYESLKQAGCQIVLTSDQSPKDIKGLKSRIQTRFEGGVLADIQAPDRDTVRAIIKAKADNLNIPEEVMSRLTRMPAESVREVEGRINKIKMFCELRKQSFSLSLFNQIFAEELSLSSRRGGVERVSRLSAINSFGPAKAQEIQKVISSKFGVSLQELRSSSRKKPVVEARNIAIYLIRECVRMPLSDIGCFFGGRKHSTLLNSLKNINNHLKKNTKLAKKLTYLKQKWEMKES